MTTALSPQVTAVWLKFALAILAGILMAFSFAPFEWWPLSIGAIVLLLYTIDKATIKQAVVCHYLFALGLFSVGISWLYVSIHTYGGASAALAVILVLLFVIFWSISFLPQAWLYARFIRQWRHGLVLGYPIIWVLGEWFRGWFLTGFPWFYLGYSHLQSPLASFAPIAGVLAVSLVACLLATFLFCLLVKRRKRYGVLSLSVFFLALGAAELEFVTPGKTIQVAAVQGNIDQHSKWQRSMVMPIVNHYRGLTEAVWGVDLVVWPEAAITVLRSDATSLLAPLRQISQAKDTALLTGIPDLNDQGRFLNSAVVIGNTPGQYVKQRLVPFGEYVPFERYLRGLIRFFDLPMSRNVAGSPGQTPLMAGDISLSVSICYEVVYPELVRSNVLAPGLLVTISNDTWFGRSSGPDQHMQIASMRALENGRYLLRATNNGITALVDHKGRIVSQLPRDTAAVLSAEVPIMQGLTPYHRFGQMPLLIGLGLLLAGLRLSSKQQFS
ncbi:MAG: apolipoprotein N-acyltransferase [Gammaproteobacteria bacterium]|nr:apolipoprotein N-acyltransferase [Gammaproteobacteria bacterium]MBT5203748.1 apolipoprotein N-acyltransferase [Gammaproteobacteria bacterium]MBT5601793.1 apolipoprotein N-acyltransferase [Gammaproteobacteria bacterium]MBT6247417.1 apolipoprotein N-acyltransferase [Gammaproteobacteria bacterium]